VNIATRDLSYRDLETPLTGLFCWNEAQEGPRPGILIIHGGAGLDAHAREQACRYAALGYAVLAQGHGKVVKWGVSCWFIAAGDVSGVPADGRRARAERWKFSR